jgi:hypothetical protein
MSSKLWVAGSSPAGGANHQVNDMLTLATRTDSGRWAINGSQTLKPFCAEGVAQ